MNLYQYAKNQLIPSVYSLGTVKFRVQRPDWSHPFLTLPNKKIFDKLLMFANFHQHGKIEAVSIIYSEEKLI